MANRRKFSSEFRAEAVELVVSSGRPIAQVAPKIGVVDRTLGTGSGSGKRNTLRLVRKTSARSSGLNIRPCRPRMAS